MTNSFRTTVLYLHRQGNPDQWFEAFLQSLRDYNAGVPYHLCLIFKGYDKRPSLADIIEHIPDCIKITAFITSDEGYDLHAYHRAAQTLQSDYILCLNSYSRAVASHWLLHYENCFATMQKPALLGATGSFECLDETTSFPNIHVRSNAFMIRRQDWLAQTMPATTKRACNQFEAGIKGLSQHMRELAIVTKNGEKISPDQWPKHALFRINNQEELIFIDNRTQHYALALPFKRKKLSQLAWRHAARISWPDFWRLWAQKRAWKKGIFLP